MSEEKLTIGKPIKVGMNYPDFKRWDVIRYGGTKDEGIIIRISNDGNQAIFHSVTYTVTPYKKFSKKWKQWLWWRILKIKVAIGDLYKK